MCGDTMKNNYFDIKIYADVARQFLKKYSVHRYRTKKISEMSDKEIVQACHSWYEENGLTKEYKSFEEKMCPNWYWPYGLHDAEIVEINELNLPPNWKAELTKYNCLEILLDAKGSRTSEIEKISFFNFKILSGNLPDKSEKKIWWLGDTLTVLSNMKYRLELFLEQANGNEIRLEIEFDIADVEYKI